MSSLDFSNVVTYAVLLIYELQLASFSSHKFTNNLFMKCYVLYHHFRIQTPGGRFSKSLRTDQEMMDIIFISILTPWLSFHKYAQ